MKLRTMIALLAVAFLLIGTSGYAQHRRADHKMMGSQVRSNQRHARDQAQTLYHMSQTPKPVPKEDVNELVATMRRDLEASNKALAKLQAEYATMKEAIVLIDSIKKHYANAKEQCTMAEKATDKPDDENAVVGECCSEIYFELDDAQSDVEKLLKLLKLDDLEVPKKPSRKKS